TTGEISLSEDILRIVKQHDDWQNSVEIKENSKGEPAITIKTRSDGDLQDLIDLALAKYQSAKDKINHEEK
ncbi:MAG: hypothetical protein QQN41_11440, partial [Nitrosopumilus sp.]